MIEQEAGVAAADVDAARLLVVMANIGFNRHTGNDKRGWQRIVVCAACREGPLVDACPTGNWRQARHRAVLNHQVEILGESANEAESFGKAGAAFEPLLESGFVEGPKAVGNPIVLFDERGGDPRFA